MVILGIDAHKRTHTVVAIDERGPRARRRRPRWRRRPTDHLSCCGGPSSSAASGCWAVEDCRHLSRRLEADLLAAGERIVRVPPKLMAHARGLGPHLRQVRPDRRAGGRPGGAARAGPARRPARRPGRELRLLVDHREDLVAERTRHQPAALAPARARPELGSRRPVARPGSSTSTRSQPGSPASDGTVARIAARARRAHPRAHHRSQRASNARSPSSSPPGPDAARARRGRRAHRGQDRRRGRRRPPVPLQGRLRPSQRHRPAAGVVGQPRPPPAVPHRQPPAQRRDPPHRRHPEPLSPRRPGLPRAPDRRATPTEALPRLKRQLSDVVYRALLADAEPVTEAASPRRA